jgi:hypothetical protein
VNLEKSATAGSIFGPKVGFEIDIDICPPTTFDFYPSGDVLLSVVLADVETSATGTSCSSSP